MLKIKLDEGHSWQDKFNQVLARLKELEPRAATLAQEYERLQVGYGQVVGEREGERVKIQEL